MAILIAVQVQQRSSEDGKETTNSKILSAVIALSKVPWSVLSHDYRS